MLDLIDASHHPADLKGLYKEKFEEKKGSGKGVYSIKVNGNWRITFQISDDGAVLLDYCDYHGKKIKAR
jgi:proteic killer suppression protein